jgi:hypothetical protein
LPQTIHGYDVDFARTRITMKLREDYFFDTRYFRYDPWP